MSTDLAAEAALTFIMNGDLTGPKGYGRPQVDVIDRLTSLSDQFSLQVIITSEPFPSHHFRFKTDIWASGLHEYALGRTEWEAERTAASKMIQSLSRKGKLWSGPISHSPRPTPCDFVVSPIVTYPSSSSSDVFSCSGSHESMTNDPVGPQAASSSSRFDACQQERPGLPSSSSYQTHETASADAEPSPCCLCVLLRTNHLQPSPCT